MNEIQKEIYTIFSYRFQWLGELIGVSVFYYYLSFLSETRGFSFDSYSIWFFSIVLIGDLSGKIANEMNLGTFEQNYLSVFSLKKLFAAKIVAAITRVFSILFVLQILHFFVTFQTISLSTYLIMVGILPSLMGISFALTGITLILKDTGWLVNILNNSLLFLSGVFFASEFFPSWIQMIAFYLPTRLGEHLRNSTSLFDISISMVVLQCVFYPLMGIIILTLCEKKSRYEGSSAYY